MGMLKGQNKLIKIGKSSMAVERTFYAVPFFNNSHSLRSCKKKISFSEPSAASTGGLVLPCCPTR